MTKHDGEVRWPGPSAVLSDGEDTSSLVGFDDVLELARKSRVSIYPIVLQSRQAASRASTLGQRRFYSEAEYSMRMLAQETGAQAYFAQRRISSSKASMRASRRIFPARSRWRTRRTNSELDGQLREVLVRVAAHPELKLRTRPGYTANLPRAVSSAFPFRPSDEPGARLAAPARRSPDAHRVLVGRGDCFCAAGARLAGDGRRRRRSHRIVRLSSARGWLTVFTATWPCADAAPDSTLPARWARWPGPAHARVPVRTQHLLGVAAVPTAVTFAFKIKR